METLCDCAERWQRLESWSEPTSPGRRELVGEGKYGKVYALGDGSVVKCVSVKTHSRNLKQTYREYVIALLQGLLFQCSVSPHVVLHYGNTMNLTSEELSLSFYMERFDSSLDACAEEVLQRPLHWLSMSFQILSVIAALAKTLRLCHNDLYSRNVLVKRSPHPHGIHWYRIEDSWYRVPVPFLCALTDFGIAASSLLDARAGAPELQPSLQAAPPQRRYGAYTGGEHVLAFKQLPPFSRDVYTTLKMCAQTFRGFPPAPGVIQRWSRACLERVDDTLAQFFSPDATPRAVVSFFSEQSLTPHELPLFRCEHERPPKSARVWVCDAVATSRVLKEATALLAAEEPAWVSEIP